MLSWRCNIFVTCTALLYLLFRILSSGLRTQNSFSITFFSFHWFAHTFSLNWNRDCTFFQLIFLFRIETVKTSFDWRRLRWDQSLWHSDNAALLAGWINIFNDDDFVLLYSLCLLLFQLLLIGFLFQFGLEFENLRFFNLHLLYLTLFTFHDFMMASKQLHKLLSFFFVCIAKIISFLLFLFN